MFWKECRSRKKRGGDSLPFLWILSDVKCVAYTPVFAHKPVCFLQPRGNEWGCSTCSWRPGSTAIVSSARQRSHQHVRNVGQPSRQVDLVGLFRPLPALIVSSRRLRTQLLVRWSRSWLFPARNCLRVSLFVVFRQRSFQLVTFVCVCVACTLFLAPIQQFPLTCDVCVGGGGEGGAFLYYLKPVVLQESDLLACVALICCCWSHVSFVLSMIL